MNGHEGPTRKEAIPFPQLSSLLQLSMHHSYVDHSQYTLEW